MKNRNDRELPICTLPISPEPPLLDNFDKEFVTGFDMILYAWLFLLLPSFREK